MGLLVLMRSARQRVFISVPPSAEPTQIVVEVTDVRSGRAWLGFDAPKDTVVHREEVWDAIARKESGA